jgi:hypothetical protein
MASDPRSDFMEKSRLLGDGEHVEDSDDLKALHLDTKDPRQRFIRDTQVLASGRSFTDVRKIYVDDLNDKGLGPRERFIRDARMLSDPDRVFGGRREVDGHQGLIMDARQSRSGRGYLKAITDEQDTSGEKDPRAALLKKLAAM